MLGSAGITARFRPQAGPLPAPVDATLAWALREGVTNVVRHSGARQADLRLGRDQENVILQLEDDGRGANAFAPGNGLRGLRERVEARGGAVDYGPGPESGFRLQVVLPLREPAAATVAGA